MNENSQQQNDGKKKTAGVGSEARGQAPAARGESQEGTGQGAGGEKPEVRDQGPRDEAEDTGQKSQANKSTKAPKTAVKAAIKSRTKRAVKPAARSAAAGKGAIAPEAKGKGGAKSTVAAKPKRATKANGKGSGKSAVAPERKSAPKANGTSGAKSGAKRSAQTTRLLAAAQAARLKVAAQKANPATAQAAVVQMLLKSVERKLRRKEMKPSLGDYIRLVQLQKELDVEAPREIKVTWVETETTEALKPEEPKADGQEAESNPDRAYESGE